MRTHYQRYRLMPIVLISLLAGCSSQQLIPNTGPNILDVYQGHMMQSTSVPNMMREMQDERRDLSAYSRSEANEIDSLFPKLPNPELVMYVFPHFTAKNRPVPGYSTSFTLFEADQYAAPGEIAP